MPRVRVRVRDRVSFSVSSTTQATVPHIDDS